MQTLGDLAQGMTLRVHQSRIKSEMNKLTTEISTGQVLDQGERVGGDFRQLAGIQHSLTRLEGYRTATVEATQIADTLQTILGKVQDEAQALAAPLASVTSNSLPTVRDTLANEALDRLGSMIGAVNVQTAGRSYLSGTQTDQSPLADVSTLMTELRSAVAGEVTSQGVVAALDAWFDTTGGGFDTVMYRGGTQDLASLRLSESETADISLRADDPTLRNILKNTALAALATDDAAGLPFSIQGDLQRAAGEGLLSANDGMTGLRAKIGTLEARIEETSIANEAEASSLAQARNVLLEADPYETASRLEEVQYQLETVYALTARSARLSLLEYLR
ncbi:flagellar hook-associated protein 3 FlgL [Primorskyibacter sedentarius]|uniref:Flagellar hook-associated protein 3 FlgL n=1 Tax=Primorskyibacter sedentarius TaxID=745311 RepID=A0A4R3JJU5_9RHOB|nr:flagellin [Primorskyibacter sedentarius]TCS66397.1 flagellar hook-associated protein 3 FlgL [Primorskyibacter sedentarius]